MKNYLPIIAFVLTFALMAADYRIRRFAGVYSYFLKIVILLIKLKFVRNILEICVKKTETYEYGYTFKICLKILKLKAITEVIEDMKGVRFDKPHNYICKGDLKLPKEDQTIFEVQFLNVEQQAELRDMMYGVQGMGEGRSEKFLTGTVALKALELGLKGWQNFNYEDTGEPIPYTKENLSCIPPKERDELANHIRGTEE